MDVAGETKCIVMPMHAHRGPGRKEMFGSDFLQDLEHFIKSKFTTFDGNSDKLFRYYLRIPRLMALYLFVLQGS